MESITHKTELFSKNHPSSLNADFGMATKTNFSDRVTQNMVTSAIVENYSSSIQVDTEEKRKKSEDSCCINGVLSITKGILSTDSLQSSNFVPIVSFSASKEKKRSSDPGSFEQPCKKQHCSSIESKKEKSNSIEIKTQNCSLETTGQMKQIESCLGFRSVFSFL